MAKIGASAIIDTIYRNAFVNENRHLINPGSLKSYTKRLERFSAEEIASNFRDRLKIWHTEAIGRPYKYFILDPKQANSFASIMAYVNGDKAAKIMNSMVCENPPFYSAVAARGYNRDANFLAYGLYVTKPKRSAEILTKLAKINPELAFAISVNIPQEKYLIALLWEMHLNKALAAFIDRTIYKCNKASGLISRQECESDRDWCRRSSDELAANYKMEVLPNDIAVRMVGDGFYNRSGIRQKNRELLTGIGTLSNCWYDLDASASPDYKFQILISVYTEVISELHNYFGEPSTRSYPK